MNHIPLHHPLLPMETSAYLLLAQEMADAITKAQSAQQAYQAAQNHLQNTRSQLLGLHRGIVHMKGLKGHWETNPGATYLIEKNPKNVENVENVNEEPEGNPNGVDQP